ncbi:MAG: hypothetical protein ABSF52_07210 [Syntrophobacteraceae bacterium]|jgi:hypothetical protein
MKIDEIQSQQVMQESRQTKGPQSAGRDDAFALLLQSEIAGPGEETAPGDAVCAPMSVPDLGIQSLSGNSAQASQVSQAISAVNGVLTQFDSLKNALQANKSPKEINALIEQLNTQIAGMDDKMSGLPADHQLSDMAEELKVTAYMESVKWKRGDYL